MDDHHPAGLLFPGKPTIFHAAPSPYGIPYRSLYSRNIANLLFAGRNISVTHAALSSTRVMGTCAMLGQAAGTAAALCQRHGCEPRSLSSGERLAELQRTLMDDDCWLPGMTRAASPPALRAMLRADTDGAALLLDGLDRDRPDAGHAWSGPLGSKVEFAWPETTRIGGVRLVFDSDLSKNKCMPCSYPHRSGRRSAVPGTLVKAFRLETMDAAGHWSVVHRETENFQRLVKVPLNAEGRALRFVAEETWGDPGARLFSMEPLETCEVKMPAYPTGPGIAELRTRMYPADLAPPEGRWDTENKPTGAGA